MKKIIRLTESELQNIVKSSVRIILKEDVLGNDWNVSDNESVYNNYEPFENQVPMNRRMSPGTILIGEHRANTI